MTIGGWIIMLGSIGFMTGLLAWCIVRVIVTPGTSEHLHSPADLDPHDQDG